MEPFNIYVARGELFNLSRSVILEKSERDLIRRSLFEEAGSENGNASVLHCLLSLREWVSYEQSSIFERMYSKYMQKYLQKYLFSIVTSFGTMCEIYLVAALGIETIASQFNVFDKNMSKNLGVNPEAVRIRLSVYSRNRNLRRQLATLSNT